jgi:uncharacterized protein (DUF2252 family)
MPRARLEPPVTTAESAARGRDAREAAPRSAHGDWARDPRVDPVAIVLGQDDTRVRALVPIRHERMAVSPFTFLRGAAAVMAADLAGTPTSGITVQLCGDAHIGNFGGFAAPDRRLVFDVNDFDETLPGPWEWDVKRLAASVDVACRDREFDDDERSTAVRASVTGYQEAMRRFASMRTIDVWYSRTEVDARLSDALDDLDRRRRRDVQRRLEKARHKDSTRALERLTELRDGVPRIVSDPPWVVPLGELTVGEDVPAAEKLIADALRTYRASLSADRRRLLASYRGVDMAHKIVGVGSVGNLAWIVLMLGRDGEDPLVLQLKEAGPSVLEAHLGPYVHDNGGRRVVDGQRLMQGAGDVLLGWARTGTHPDGRARDYYVRQLWDAKLSVQLEILPPLELQRYATTCGEALARAHARSGDRFAIAAYLGRNERFAEALVRFASAYGDQNERDHAAFAAAVAPA